ncbi:MAG: hypothetical protein REI95_05240 [Oxalicibacterium faecigallinarum]|uniref:hypothetical protein n=1 Tax=Oxalicibacterium faecigallinarum TaxID=573741 RepID=UPI0028099565|nr:hypothetical protein [Oxalicibacterium faecigallinarum]MDQ7969029.1 hypothetical protein [Oxalicibacterium faecigallinarum]
MANKALAKRQRMTIRQEPSQKAPRNPFALAAKQRAAGPHQPAKLSQRPGKKQLLNLLLQSSKDD